MNEFTISRNPRPGRTLVLAAHPDDEVLGCGGAIIRHVLQGDPVFIVIMTDGGFAVHPGQLAPGYGLLRKRESMEAASVLGCGVPRFAGFADQGLSMEKKLGSTISELITEYRPDNIYLPSLTEIHPDHKALSHAGTSAISNHPDDFTLYYYETGAPLTPNFYLDISDINSLKHKAIDCFVSQLKVQNLKTQIAGLNQYRTYYLPTEVKSAEAYFTIRKSNLHHLKNVNEATENNDIKCVDKNKAGLFPLINVIIRTMNRIQLPEALESVASQTYPNIGIILVDATGGMSITDISVSSRIKLKFVSKGRALSRPEAANAGLESVDGDYFCFLDEDDLLDPAHLYDLWRCLHYRDELFAYSGIRLTDEEGTEQRIYNEPFVADHLKSDNFLPIHASLFRRQVIDHGCRFDEQLAIFEDWDFLLNVVQYGSPFHLNKVSGTYRNYRSSDLYNDQGKARQFRQKLYDKWQDIYQKEELNNHLATYFYRNRRNIIHKWPHYFRIYHKYFQRYINTECVIIEIGVSLGGSLQMWRSYFGDKARIIGIDINPECKKFTAPGIEIIIGDQGDREFLKSVANRVPRIDILIDDGGHRMEQQIASFEELFPHISNGGVYLCEDTHTSYFEQYGGGLRKEGTFIEYVKGLTDHLHSWHIPGGARPVSEYTRNIQAISFFDSMVVIEKLARVQPWSEMRGTGIMEGKEPITPEFVDIFRTKLKLLGAGLPDYHDVGALMSSPVLLQSYLGDLYDGRIWPGPGETMIGWQRLTQLEQCVTDVLDKSISGDFIETGVWKGGACIFMCYLLKMRGIRDRKVWFADSFQGLPAPEPAHYPQDDGFTLHQIPTLAISEEEVRANLQKYGLEDANTGFLKGWFKETMPDAPIEKLAILRLDGDMYQSTMDVLTALYPKLVPGGYCIIDDYGAIEPCRQAVEDYRQVNGIRDEIKTIDYTGIYWKKLINAG